MASYLHHDKLPGPWRACMDLYFFIFLKFSSFLSFVAPTTIYIHIYFSTKKNLSCAFLFITNNIIKKINKYKQKYIKNKDEKPYHKIINNARDCVFFSFDKCINNF